MILHVICPACQGTGVYVGFGEKKGASVVCSRCSGTGGVDQDILLFTERVRRADVKTVALPGSNHFLIPGADPGEVTYEEFLAGKLPDDRWDERRTR